MRAGHNYDLLRFTVAAAFGSRAQKELVAATLCFVFAPVVCKLESIHVRRQTLRRCHLRHGAMKRCVPARIISGMTRAAGIRTRVPGDLRLDGAILWRYSFALEIAERNQRENGCSRNRCDDEQPLPPRSRQLPHSFRGRYYEKEYARANTALQRQSR